MPILESRRAEWRVSNKQTALFYDDSLLKILFDDFINDSLADFNTFFDIDFGLIGSLLVELREVSPQYFSTLADLIDAVLANDIDRLNNPNNQLADDPAKNQSLLLSLKTLQLRMQPENLAKIIKSLPSGKYNNIAQEALILLASEFNQKLNKILRICLNINKIASMILLPLLTSLGEIYLQQKWFPKTIHAQKTFNTIVEVGNFYKDFEQPVYSTISFVPKVIVIVSKMDTLYHAIDDRRNRFTRFLRKRGWWPESTAQHLIKTTRQSFVTMLGNSNHLNSAGAVSTLDSCKTIAATVQTIPGETETLSSNLYALRLLKLELRTQQALAVMGECETILLIEDNIVLFNQLPNSITEDINKLRAVVHLLNHFALTLSANNHQRFQQILNFITQQDLSIDMIKLLGRLPYDFCNVVGAQWLQRFHINMPASDAVVERLNYLYRTFGWHNLQNLHQNWVDTAIALPVLADPLTEDEKIQWATQGPQRLNNLVLQPFQVVVPEQLEGESVHARATKYVQSKMRKYNQPRLFAIKNTRLLRLGNSEALATMLQDQRVSQLALNDEKTVIQFFRSKVKANSPQRVDTLVTEFTTQFRV